MLSCMVLLCIGDTMVMGDCLRLFSLNMKEVWDIVSSELDKGTTSCSVECFGVIYGEWYGMCDFVVF